MKVVLAMSALVLQGCIAMATPPLDESVRVKLAPRVTTKQDVRVLFGRPEHAESLAARDQDGCIEPWDYTESSATDTRFLTVAFRENGRICSWRFQCVSVEPDTCPDLGERKYRGTASR
jgi:hypothetical protein